MAHNQDEQIVKQAIKCHLLAISFGKSFAQQQFAHGCQGRMRRDRQDHHLRQALADRVALGIAKFDRSADEIGTALGIDNKTMDPFAWEEQQRRLGQHQVSLAVACQGERACL